MMRHSHPRRRPGTVAFSVVFALLALLGAPVRADPARAEQRISALCESGPGKGSFGIAVADPLSGEVLFGFSELTPRIPASVMKIVTTGAVWLLLGPGESFETKVLGAAEPGPDRVLAGDLVVLGGGDPSLGVGRQGEAEGSITALARAVAARISRVDGDLVLDDSLFDRELRHPGWPTDQLDRPYCAPVAALTVNRSCIDVIVTPGSAAGEPGRVRLAPDTSVLSLRNRTTTSTGRHLIVFDLAREDAILEVRGDVKLGTAGYRGAIAAPAPVELFGDVFRRALIREGVSVAGKARREAGRAAALPDPVLLARHESAFLPVIRETNRESRNLYAEAFFKTLGARLSDEGSFAGGARATARLLPLLRAPEGHLVQVDGSGLARENRVTPLFVVRLLCRLYQPESGNLFPTSLAMPGEEEGTLTRRLKELSGDVFAKTGTISGASALAGYVRGKQKRPLAFAILVNDDRMSASRAREFQDAVVRILHQEH